MRLFATVLFFSCSIAVQAQTTFTCLDLEPGNAPSTPRYLSPLNGKLIFSAKHATQGIELWSGDGTLAGTQVLKDLNVGGDASPLYLTQMNNKLYFAANDGTHNGDLYVTDGTAAGTQLVKDIDGTGGKITISETKIVATANKLFFVATDATNGTELWVSDGTAAGTHIVKDINPGWNTSDPNYLCAFNNKVYFKAKDSGNDSELWVTDGTEAGTMRVAELRPGTDGSSPYGMTVAGGKMYFIATDASGYGRTFVSDGTTAGTVLLTNAVGLGYTEYNGKVYFYASQSPGRELFETDGTPGGTKIVKDLYTGTANPSPFSFAAMVFNGKLYFNANDVTNGSELFVTDGTDAGTHLVKDIFPGTGYSSPQSFFVYAGSLFFTADEAAGNRQLFMTDGTAAGTQKIAPPNPNKDALGATTQFVEYNGAIYFAANYDVLDTELWRLKIGPDGVPELRAQNQLAVYPNPAQDVLTVMGVENGNSLFVTDINGQKLYMNGNIIVDGNKATIDIATLPAGVYLLHSGASVSRFVKVD